MSRYAFTREDRVNAYVARGVEGCEARKLRRQAEMWLLNRLLAEAAMPEWYPHQ